MRLSLIHIFYFYTQNNRYFLKYMLKRRGLLDEVYLPFPNESGVPDPFIVAELEDVYKRQVYTAAFRIF